MAVDMMVRLLNGETPGDKEAGFPFRSGPVIQIISKETMEQWSYERLFGPRGFKPVFRYDPQE
jgi:protein TorT